jgi:hypothetical protein
MHRHLAPDVGEERRMQECRLDGRLRLTLDAPAVCERVRRRGRSIPRDE